MKSFYYLILILLLAGCSNTLPVVAQQSELAALTFNDDSLSKSINLADISSVQNIDVTCDSEYSRIEISLEETQVWRNVSIYTRSSGEFNCDKDETVQIDFDVTLFGFSNSIMTAQTKKFYLRGAGKNGFSEPSEVQFLYTSQTSLVISSGVDGSNILQFGSVTYQENSSNMPVVFTNSGTTSITNISPSLTNGTQYSIQSNNCDDLAVGETCTISFRFTPNVVAASTDTVTLNYQNTSGQSANLSFSLNGTGLAKSVTLDKISSTYSNWNSYYLASNTSSTCVGDEGGNYDNLCIHGGLARKIVTLESTCTGLTAVDNLGVFNWVCEIEASVAVFKISGFNTGKGLRDLIDWQVAPLWRTPIVSISKSSVVTYTTTAVAQWTNAFVELTSQPTEVVASTASDIYYADENIDIGGLRISADQVTLVSKAGVTIKLDSGAANNCEILGDSSVDDALDRICLVHSNNKFLWIEADLDANDIAHMGLLLMNTSQSRIHETTLSNNNTTVEAAFMGLGIESNLFTDFHITDYKKYGIYLDSVSTDTANQATYNQFLSSTVTDTNLADEGIYLTANTNNNSLITVVLTDTTASDSGTANTVPP